MKKLILLVVMSVLTLNAAVSDQLPLQITIKQRASESPSIFNGKITIRLDDITGGQVVVRVTGTEPRSMKKGDVISFAFEGKTYQLRLIELRNFLIDPKNEDNADFVIAEESNGTGKPGGSGASA